MVSALLTVTGDIKAGMESTEVTTVVLIDFSNAFNTVRHESLPCYPIIFLSLLRSTGLVFLLLRDRQQLVGLKDSSSGWCGLCAGVLQGIPP